MTCHQCGEKIVDGAIFCNPQCAENFFYDEDGAIDYATFSPDDCYMEDGEEGYHDGMEE